MRRLARVVVVLGLLAGSAACSSGDDDPVAKGSTSTRRPAGTEDKEAAAYCRIRVEVETTPEPEIDAAAGEAQQVEARKAYATGLQPDMEQLEEAAPTEVHEHVAALVAAVDTLAATGSAEALTGTPEVQEARRRLHDFDLEHCGWGEQDLSAQEYAFEGLDESLDAGPVSIELENEGAEYHELAVIKKQDGTTESFAEILALEDEEQQQAKATFVGGIAAVAPGSGAYAIVDLSPGEYLVACFLSVGSTPERFKSGAAVDGAPHYSRGMQRQVTVSAA